MEERRKERYASSGVSSAAKATRSGVDGRNLRCGAWLGHGGEGERAKSQMMTRDHM